MSQAKRKNTIQVKNPDAELFNLHDRFCAAYGKMKKYDTPSTSNGSLSTGTKEEKRLHRKWEAACEVAFRKARAVLEAPAYTLEGMLTKLHVAGFSIIHTKPGTFTGPDYRSGTRLWEPGTFGDDQSEEMALIVSLRDDLHRFAGRRA
jgi:hypothetical protein